MAGIGSLMGGNFSNTSNDTQGCNPMSDEKFRTATGLTIGFNSFTCLACIIAILLNIFQKAYKIFLMRLLLYLNLCVFFFMFTEIMETLPVDNENGLLVVHNKKFCIAAGFFGVFFASLFILAKFSLALYLLLLSKSEKKKNICSKRREKYGVVIVLIIASGMAIIPLIPFDGDPAYGIIEIYCWIEHNDPDCDDAIVGTVERIVLWYVPLFATAVIMIVAIFYAVRSLRQKPARELTPTEETRFKEAHLEAQTLTLYVVIFILLYAVNTVLHLAYILPQLLGDYKTFGLAMAALVAQPMLLLSVPAAFIFHPSTVKRLEWRELKQAANKWRGIHDEEVYSTHRVPPEPEFSEYSELIVNTSPRNRHDSGYKTMLEQPDVEAD